MPYLQRKAADTLIGSGTQAPDTGLHRKEQAAPIDSVQELRLLRDGTHCIRCRCTFFPHFLSIPDNAQLGYPEKQILPITAGV